MRTVASRCVSWLAPLLLAVGMAAGQPTLGAEGRDIAGKALPKKSKAKGRLPPYYRQVVTEQQRQKIYEIQQQYHPKIEALEGQLKALKNERDEKIAAVLTPEQKKLVGEAATKAKQKEKLADTAPATPPPEQNR